MAYRIPTRLVPRAAQQAARRHIVSFPDIFQPSVQKYSERKLLRCVVVFLYFLPQPPTNFVKYLRSSSCRFDLVCSFSPQLVYDVVADVDSYKHFVPWCRKSIVKSRSVRVPKAESNLVVSFLFSASCLLTLLASCSADLP